MRRERGEERQATTCGPKKEKSTRAGWRAVVFICCCTCF